MKKRLARFKRALKRAPLSYYVAFSFLMIITYSIAELVLTSMDVPSHDTLTACWFACWSGEVLMSCLIKIFKLRKEDSNGLDS